MSFCKYCGSQLGDGMLCSCERAVAERNGSLGNTADKVAQDNTFNAGKTNMQAQPDMNMNGQPGSASFNNGELNININIGAVSQITAKLGQILKEPITVGKEFVKTASIIEIMAFILLQSICSGIFATVEISKINSYMKSAMGDFEDLISQYMFSGIRGFFVTVVFSTLISFVFAAIIFGIFKLKKENVDFREVLGIISVRSAVEAPIIFASAILFFVYMPIASLIFYLSSLVGFFIVALLLAQYENVGKDQTAYIMIAVVIIMLVVYYFVAIKGVRLYLPPAINKEIDKIPTISDILSQFEKGIIGR